MKKIILIITIVALLLPFTGCRRDQEQDLDYSLVDRDEEQLDQDGQEAGSDGETGRDEEGSEHGEDLALEDLFEPVFVTVTGSSVRIRQGPGTRFEIIGSARAGDQLEVIYFMEHWINIKMENGQEGYIAGWLTDARLPEPDGDNLEEEKMELVP